MHSFVPASSGLQQEASDRILEPECALRTAICLAEVGTELVSLLTSLVFCCAFYVDSVRVRPEWLSTRIYSPVSGGQDVVAAGIDRFARATAGDETHSFAPGLLQQALCASIAGESRYG